jgi:molybdate transport system substrate-binding protein
VNGAPRLDAAARPGQDAGVRHRAAVAVAAATVAVAVALAASPARPATTASPAPAVLTTLEVLAAASLAEAFAEIGRDFERHHQGVTVRLQNAGSSALVRQVLEGAAADVLATADEDTMARVVRAGEAAGTAVLFARNRLAIAVHPEAAARVGSLVDLGRPGLVVVLCAPQVPCGALADRALARAGVTLEPASREPSVKAVLTRVLLGEADAGLVYRSDLVAAGDRVVGRELPSELGLTTAYPAVVLARAPNPKGARIFLAWLQGEPARAVLARHGFRAP